MSDIDVKSAIQKTEVKDEINKLKETIGNREQHIVNAQLGYTLGSVLLGGALAVGGIAAGDPTASLVGMGAGATALFGGAVLADRATAKSRSEQKIDQEYLATIMDTSLGEREKARGIGEEIVGRGYQGYLPQVFPMSGASRRYS